MRKINFRAWHREKQMMCDVIAVGVMDGWVDIMPAPDSSWTTDLDDVELMQFTGLLDKNGVEIYESDVIEIIWEWDGKRTIHEVYWGGEYPAFDLRPTTGDESNNLHSLMVCRENEIAVIGNIHQNPDLLELSNIEKT